MAPLESYRFGPSKYLYRYVENGKEFLTVVEQVCKKSQYLFSDIKLKGLDPEKRDTEGPEVYERYLLNY